MTPDERISALEDFVAEVVFDYLEMHKYDGVGQCQWCLWIPDRDYDPVHNCSALRWANDPQVQARLNS